MAKKQTTNLPVQFDAELARQAEAYRAAEAATVSGNFISVRGGIMQWRGSPLEGNKFNGIILASIFENDYYVDPFDPDSPASPSCYAFGTKQDALKPHDESEKKEGDANGLCANCWANGFGSSPTGGRGKACQNRRRLCVIPATNLTPEGVAAAEFAFIRVPVMSVSGYSNHVMQIADVLKLPPFGVVTEVSLVPDPKSQYRMLFKSAAQVKDRAVLAALFERANAAAKALPFPYMKNSEAIAANKPPSRRAPPKGTIARGRAAPKRPPPSAAAQKPLKF